jgi:glyoxylase-like metal-dependent hydrolase (beta-lactamase superfamily II)
MRRLTLGDVVIDRLVETEGPGYEVDFFFPDATVEAFEEEAGWLAPHFWDPAQKAYLRAVQSFVVRTPHHTVVVDSCVGHMKERPSTPHWHRQPSTWLDQLRAAGVEPETVDYVMCTHLHADHVGWNTRLVDGRWAPTFPNARYIFHRDELAHWEARPPSMGGTGTEDACFEDSVLPVIAAGQAEIVGNDFGLDDAFTLLPTPGHTPGHCCVNLNTAGGRAVISGDVLHHPIQVARPEWNSRFCIDPARSRASRKAFVEAQADTGAWICAAHFASPGFGRIVSDGARCIYRV